MVLPSLLVPIEPVLSLLNTIPSVAELPPGNCAYPKTVPAEPELFSMLFTTQTFKYLFLGQGVTNALILSLALFVNGE